MIKDKNMPEYDIKKKIQLKNKFFSNPLFEIAKKKYPFRDYDYEFYLMCDLYLNKKKRLPIYFSSFNNWLKNTKIDEGLKHKKEKEDAEKKWQQQQEQMEREKCRDATPFLNKMRKELVKKMSV